MSRWCTIVAINPAYRDPNSCIPGPIDLGNAVIFDQVPEWFAENANNEDIGHYHRQILRETEFTLRVEYEADCLGDKDPDWPGDQRISKEDSAAWKIELANLALWVAKPSSIGYQLKIDAMYSSNSWWNRRVSYPSSILVQDSEIHNSLTTEDFGAAKTLNESLCGVPHTGAVLLSARTLWKALLDGWQMHRYLLLWVALEALFGPSDAREIIYRISQRIAFFLTNGDRQEAKVIFGKAKQAYQLRCKVVHGIPIAASRRGYDEMRTTLPWTEDLLRKILTKILQNAELIGKFNGQNRDRYLDSLVF